MKKLITLLIIITCSLSLLSGMRIFRGITKVNDEPVTQLTDIPDTTPGVDLVEITTKSGYVVQIPRALVPVDDAGNMIYPVVDITPNEKLESAADMAYYIPGPGTIIGSVLSGILALTTLNQKKQKQAEIDARIKEEGKVKLRDKLLIAAAVGIEVATTDGAIKTAIKKRMTKAEQAAFDEITEEDRVLVAT